LENRNWKQENWKEKRKRKSFNTEGTEEEHRVHGEREGS
jgi:hypothetical protein